MAYDLIVIGTGPGGYVCAIRAAQLGMKVAVVEKWSTFGGTCLNVGCIPSKAMLFASERFEEVTHAFPKMGIKVGKPELDLPTLLKFKDQAVDGNTKGVAFLFKKNKIDPYQGVGRILGAGKVEVKAADGKTEVLETKNIVIATGSDVAKLKGIEIDEKRVISSTGALTLGKVPGKLLIVGAGIIGLELGSVWRRLGAQITVVEFLDRILPGMDGEVARQFQRMLEKQGMAFKLGSKVTSVDTSGKTLKVSVEPAAGGAAETIEADVVLVSIGRVPYTEGLGLKEAGVAVDNRGRVEIDDHFATNVKGIYAIGDVVRGAMLGAQGRGRRHRGRGDSGRPGRPCELRRDPGRGLHLAGSRLRRQDRGRTEGRGHRLQCRQVPVHGERPRQVEPADRRLREVSGGCEDRSRVRRAHRRHGGRRNDPRMHAADRVRRLVRGSCAHLPCASDALGSCQGSGHERRQARHSYVKLASKLRVQGGGRGMAERLHRRIARQRSRRARC